MSAVSEPREPVFYTEIDNGRLFIAKDQYFQGRSINSYNNFFTKFFAWLFGRTYEATLNGQTYVLNKKSYAKFIHECGLAPLNEHPDYRNINTLLDGPTFSTTLMRHAFAAYSPTSTKAHQLAKELFVAIASNVNGQNDNRIQSLIGRGADINAKAWYRQDTGEFIFHDLIGQGLPVRPYKPFQAFHFTPLMLAASKAQWATSEKLLHFFADPRIAGERSDFIRQYLGSNQTTSAQIVSRPVVYTATDRHGSRPKIKHQPGMDLVTHRTDQYEDTYYNRVQLASYDNGYSIVEVGGLLQFSQPVSETYTTGRLPLI